MWTALTLLSCQEPFGADRHDLVGFRVAAISVSGADPRATVIPRVAVVVDGRPWAEAPTSLRWTWLTHPDELVDLDGAVAPDATGAAPALTVPDDRRVLALIATAPSGREARAFVTVPEPPAAVSPITRLEVSSLPLSLGRVTAEALQIEARRRLDPGADPIVPGGFARIRAEVLGDPLVRWMATGGTFFELDRQTADWAAGDLRLDGDEIDEDVSRVPLDPGFVTVVALALGAGATTFEAVDLPVDLDVPGVWLGDRFLPTSSEVTFGPGQQLRGTLVADDTSPCGLTLDRAAPEPLDTGDGPGVLPCDPPVVGPFHPALLLEQRCGRAQLDGVEVVVVPEVRR